MIAKKQPKNAQYKKSRAQDVGDLCRYICDARSHMTSRPTSSSEPEKVLCSGSLGLNFKTLDAKISEMAGLAAQAKSGNPVDHWVLSWQTHEAPTPDQLHEAARMFIHEMGLDGHQVVYGAHQNTQNIHLHLAINRVSPTTGRVIKVNRGFDHLAAARAICIIEAAQGWNQEPNPVFRMTPQGPQERTDRKRGLSDAARAAETATAMPSLERRAKALAPTIAAATSWQDLHRRLAAQGCTYEKRKGGAVLKFGKAGFIKASKCDRAASLAALEKRFGAPFQRPEKLVPRPYQPAPPTLRSDLDPVSLILALIFRLLGFHRAARAVLHTQQELERAELRAAKFHSAQQKWAAQSVLREEHAAARADLKAAQDAEIAAIKKMTPAQAAAYCKQHNLFPTTTQKQPPAPNTGAEKEKLMNNHTQNFNIVHAALGATRYRLIAKDEAAAPGKTPRHFTHGKAAAGPAGLTSTGAFVGWTPDEVRAHMPEVTHTATQDRYGTYITPLSADTHFILIDDINTPEKLEKSEKYAAALEVESSPGNRQKVLKIKADPDPALAKKAANACAARINQECGDPAVRNGEQAWRMPGFNNNKPKHRRADGSAPEVTILSARGGYCFRAQHIYNEELARLRELQQQQPTQQPPHAAPAALSGSMPINEKNHRGIPWTDLYREHGADLAERIKGIASRPLDYALACRFRAMGYSDGEATRILAHGREWTETVRRGSTPIGTWDQEVARVQKTVRDAYYTPAGDRDSGRLGPNAIKAANRVESDYAREIREQPAPDQNKEPEQKTRRRRSRGR